MKKIILTVFAATSLLLYSTPSFAFSISVGVPVGSTITGEVPAGWTQFESEGVSGYFLGVQLPFAVGLGLDSYKTNLKVDPGESELKLATSMYNLFYQLPVPVVSLILGLGTGNSNYDCPGCAEIFDKGAATQWYTSIGFPIIPFFDIHLSYRSITSKNIKDPDGSKYDVSGTVTGIGLAFNF